MNNSSNICYILNEHKNMELILCSHSTKSYPMHNHVSVYTIGYLLDGSIDIKTNAGLCRYKKGGIFTIPPYLPHELTSLQPYSLLSLCIHKTEIKKADFLSIHSNVLQLLHHINLLDHVSQEEICHAIHTITEDNACYPQALLPNANNIVRQLEQHPEEKFSIEEMAKKAYTSKYQFIRNFKRDIGLTPHQFQIQNQVRKAQKALAETESITEVALNSGFFDQSHFIKHFEKIVQLTPAEYKASCQTVITANT